jgi:hypothetical protein
MGAATHVAVVLIADLDRPVSSRELDRATLFDDALRRHAGGDILTATMRDKDRSCSRDHAG